MSAVEQLCPQCGLCCNGVLFGDVELQQGDDARALRRLGLELFKKGRKQAFAQPCACHDGTLCRIYADRPKRCRTFECNQIKRVDSGELSLDVAEQNVREARRLVDEVLRLVRALGNADNNKPLNERYSAIMAQPMDLSGGDESLELRGELMLAVGRLVDVLEKDFLVRAG